MPQFLQGFLQPHARTGTSKPQRLQTGDRAVRRSADLSAGRPVGLAESADRPIGCPSDRLPACPPARLPARPSPKRKRSRQERIGEALDADRGVGAVPAVV